jgi:hypothetical protein
MAGGGLAALVDAPVVAEPDVAEPAACVVLDVGELWLEVDPHPASAGASARHTMVRAAAAAGPGERFISLIMARQSRGRAGRQTVGTGLTMAANSK